MKWLPWRILNVFFFLTRKTCIRRFIKGKWQIRLWKPLDGQRLPCCFYKPTTPPIGWTQPGGQALKLRPRHIHTISISTTCTHMGTRVRAELQNIKSQTISQINAPCYSPRMSLKNKASNVAVIIFIH